MLNNLQITDCAIDKLNFNENSFMNCNLDGGRIELCRIGRLSSLQILAGAFSGMSCFVLKETPNLLLENIQVEDPESFCFTEFDVDSCYVPLENILHIKEDSLDDDEDIFSFVSCIICIVSFPQMVHIHFHRYAVRWQKQEEQRY